MDKNFELMARVIEQKKKAKEDNLLKRYYLTEVLDDMEKEAKLRDMMNREKDQTQKHNTLLGKIAILVFKYLINQAINFIFYWIT